MFWHALHDGVHLGPTVTPAPVDRLGWDTKQQKKAGFPLCLPSLPVARFTPTV